MHKICSCCICELKCDCETWQCEAEVMRCITATTEALNVFLLLLLSQAVTALVKNFPKPMVSSMQQILPIVWNTLTESAALYPFIKPAVY